MAVHVSVRDALDRRSLLVGEPPAMGLSVAGGWAFVDLEPGRIELLVPEHDRHASDLWLAAHLRRGVVERLERVSSSESLRPHIWSPATATEVWDTMRRCSRRAVEVITRSQEPVVDLDVVVEELARIHAEATDPVGSVAWHLAWMIWHADDQRGHAPSSADPRHPFRARLAHVQFLRLRGGEADHRAEASLVQHLLERLSPP